jgi:signal transduction histidine kinase
VELEDAAQGSITVDASALSAATVSTDIPREIVGQILRELVNNAVVACASIGGARTVRVTAALLGRNIDDVESPDSRGRTEHRPRGEAFVCTIEDDGPGIPSDDLERVFRPFQSSHASHRGLGLFIARAQVRRLGGALDLLPREGGGTIARVRLPASLVTTASGRRAAPHGPATPTPGSTPTALTREQEAL